MALLAASAAQDKQQVNPDIVYKYSDAFELIWRDGGSGADRSGSIWRSLNFQSEYCSVGDVATGDWSKPTDKAVFVSQRKEGALVNPTSFTAVWTDQGSTSDDDVTIYKMNAPAGYTCLGGVAVNSYSTKPDPKKYCCVKDEYVVQGDIMFAWNDKGSGATQDGSLWTVVRAGGEVYGVNAGTFIPVQGHSKPALAHLLKGDESKVRDVWKQPKGKEKPLNVYEVGELKFIWSDLGSGATQDISFWRAEAKNGYYPPGDIAVKSHGKPTLGFLLKQTDDEDDIVRVPVSYKRIWNDGGSGADRNVQLWSVNCPAGYVSLGDVATDGREPEFGSVYCVKSIYTTIGTRKNWETVWVDHGAAADRDVTIFRAIQIPENTKQQSLGAFKAVPNYKYKPNPPYFLNLESVAYWEEKPVEKIEMYNVKYNLEGENKQSSPVKVSPITVNNFSDQIQKVVRQVSYSFTECSSFSFSLALQLGVEVEFKASTPIIGGGGKTTISATIERKFTSGGTSTTVVKHAIEARMNSIPRTKQSFYILATEYKADIPYTATIKKFYFDGSTAMADVSGVYKGVATSHGTITMGKTEYIDRDWVL